jgi:endonuclease/exonuclease/phosphatase family metal-dependent hydrolase
MPRRRVTPAPASASLAGLVLAATLAVAPAAPADPADELRARDGQRVDRTFSVAAFNILGSQHTKRRDKRRTVRTARLIRRTELKLIAMQEVQDDQLRRLKVHLPRYRFWPGENLGPGGLRLQIAWLRTRFDLIDTGSITTTFSNQERPVPWVRLRDEATGRRLFVIDVHNSPLEQEADRDAATREEVRLFRRLRERGGPVLILGDANERREWFCKVARRTGARAANGGSVSDVGCTPPDPSYVDWLMGDGQFGWRDYRAQDVEVSDHRLHSATFRWRKV